MHDVNWKVHDLDKNKSNIVYKLTFPDSKIYIGKTTRKLIDRLKEHNAKPKSKLLTRRKQSTLEKHITALTHHNPIYVDVEIIAHHNDSNFLLVLESSHIQEASKYLDVLNTHSVV